MKNTILISIGIIIGILLTGYYYRTWGCGCNVTQKVDTVYKKFDTSITSSPEPRETKETPTAWADHSQIPTSSGKKSKTVYRPIEKQRGWLGRLFHATPADTVHAVVEDPKFTDTAALFKDYYSIKHYSDTFAFKYGKTIINETVHENKIETRQVLYDLSLPMETKTTIVSPKPLNRFYAGFDFGTALGVNIMLQTKKSAILGLHYDWNFHPNLLLTYDKPIFR